MSIKKITLSALFLALCYVLPLITGNIPEIGKMLLPLHLPVFFAGLLLGWQYGLFIGIVAPLTRSLIFGSPILYPDAIVMALELATYGVVSGLLYKLLDKINKYLAIYISLISAILIGRIIWGLAKTLLVVITDYEFSFALFIAGGFINAWPGILLQLILIPLLVPLLERFIDKNNKDKKEDAESE